RFRFSTKYHDDETGNDVYQQRQYISPLGCWASRDPIEERGGHHLYGFVGNKSTIAFDKLGLEKLTLTYDMQRRDRTSWLERLMMPGNTVWSTSMTDALNSLIEKVGKFDPDGVDCNCIRMLTISGHSGIPGFISFGGGSFIDPKSIRDRDEILKKYENNPVYKDFIEKQNREHDFLVAVSGLMCRNGAVIRFAQCQTEHPETRKFLEEIFGDDVTVILYELDVKWKWKMPVEVPIEFYK
ncbi:MAG: RHS repeat-associated core domain-containing protein, partial [bacterium]